MYILLCNDGTYFTGSTIDLDFRIQEHTEGKGAHYTLKRLPVKLVYFEEYETIKEAFNREKQIQKWSQKRKLALIEGKRWDISS